MQILSERKINSVMVEGGAQVITSFVNARLVDQFVVTISPRFVGGLSVLNANGMHFDTNLELTEVSYLSMGEDLIIWA
jgi:3,4-dihydroxy 2-butanone 4-phosphate synthase/GTP cyclohydrolase II